MNAREMGETMKEVGSGRRLIYFSSVPYASYAQRPHFMVSAFADSGFDRILWVDPYPTRFPTFADLRRRHSSVTGIVHPADPRIQVLRPRALPIEPAPLSGVVNRVAMWSAVCEQLKAFADAAAHCELGIGRPSKLADWAIRNVQHKRSFADVLDYFPAFYRGISRLSMRRRLNALLRNVDHVFCSSTALARDTRSIRPDAVTVLNGYPTSCLPQPSEAECRRYIGYVGSIAEWFDWPLVVQLAEALPGVSVRLIGPEFVPRPTNLPANIQFVGEVPQDRVVTLVQEFVVGLIPFRDNTLTEYVDPIKFYEYRSMGVPIWSTAFGEMVHRNQSHGVTHIEQGSDWRALWRAASTIKTTASEIKSFRHEVDWSGRFGQVISQGNI